MKKKIILTTLVSSLTLGVVQADSSSTSGKWSAGVGISTLGLGANVGYKFNESFKIRGIVNYFQYSKKFNDDELALSTKLRLLTAGIMGDWHFAQNGFRLTGGLVYNGNRFKMNGTPSRNVVVNGRTYTPAEIGEVQGTLDFRPIAPYIGIGYDSGHEKKCGFAFTAEVGVLFQGKVRGKVNKITGALASQARAINDMKDYTVAEVNKSRLIKTYPVLSIGLSYKF